MLLHYVQIFIEKFILAISEIFLSKNKHNNQYNLRFGEQIIHINLASELEKNGYLLINHQAYDILYKALSALTVAEIRKPDRLLLLPAVAFAETVDAIESQHYFTQVVKNIDNYTAWECEIINSIANIISRLEMSNAQTGKMAFLKAIDLIGPNGRKYILSLSQLRNNLVHKLENTSFTFDEWISKMDKNQLKQNAINFSPQDSLRIKVYKKSKVRKEQGLKCVEIEKPNLNKIYNRFKSYAKDHIWFGLHHLLVYISDAKGYSDYLQEKRFSEFLYDFDTEV